MNILPFELPPEFKTNGTNRRIRELITAINKKSLIPRPDFQRRLVWTNKDQVEFLKTILANLPFPEIYVCAGEVNTETAEGTEWLVDGQQRVSTIYSYFIGHTSLKLGTALPPYKQLTESNQRRFLEYTVVVRDLGNIPVEMVKEIFQRINSTKYGLNAMELSNARYNGAIKKFAEATAESAFYENHKVFAATDIRRMGDVSFQLSLIITMHSGYFNDVSLHEEYLEKYNDEFPHADEYKLRLAKVFSFIDDLALPSNSRWWKKADIFSLLVELDKALNEQKTPVDPEKFKKSLIDFEEDLEKLSAHDTTLGSEDSDRVKELSRYTYAAAQGSLHRKNRVTRGEVLKKLIDESVEK